MDDIIVTDQLTKSYRDSTVVDHVDLRVPHGCVYGFLGPNGAGKSTTMKMLLSLVQPTHGEVEILGRPMNRRTRRELLGQIGSLIEAPPGYVHLTGAENLKLVQRQLGLDQGQVDRAVHIVRMQEQLDKKVGNYSLGMKQRLGIAMALARDPRLLILDEPTNGLDPAGIEEMRDLLRRLADGGVTVMVSSHLLDEIDRMATVMGVLKQGRLIFQGSRSELFAASAPDVVIDSSDPQRVEALLTERRPSRVNGRLVRVPGLGEQETARTIAHLARNEVDVFEVRREAQTLEQTFMSLTGGSGAL